MKSLPSLYQEFIHLSRYSRWIEEKGRRETWEETVDRYFKFFDQHFAEQNIKISKSVRDELRQTILDLEVMPSMRALMTAGEALVRDNTAGYNCAYVAVNKVRAFDEILHVLMCGTGVGFSVEKKYTDKLPTIAEQFTNSDTVIVVKDSKEGWAKAYRELISLLIGGQVPKWDMTKIRPAGARLKTFGGRASGPGPLEELFAFTVTTFRKSAGRKLSSLECHDIICKIAEVVVVGGVRRCQIHTYMVETTNGWKQISTIVTGDKVIFNGKESTVTNVFDNGIQETVNIHMEDGTTHICTEEHRWFVYDHDDSTTKWIETKELKNGNYSMLRPKNHS